MATYKPTIRWWSLVDMRLMAHFTESLEVGADRLTFRKGAVSENEIVIPFSRITNYSDHQGLFDRIFGAGNFIVETAGLDHARVDLEGLPRPTSRSPLGGRQHLRLEFQSLSARDRQLRVGQCPASPGAACHP